MKNSERNIIIGVSGASGSVYAKILFEKLASLTDQYKSVSVIFSTNAIDIWKHEIKDTEYRNFPFIFFENHDFHAGPASGSAGYDAMIICPCSMGTMGRIAGGFSDSLITRVADVMLKERKKLILVPRETPYNLIHIENMRLLTLAGAIICPANPSFYSLPGDINEVVATVVDRVLDLSGFSISTFRWK